MVPDTGAGFVGESITNGTIMESSIWVLLDVNLEVFR
jgi:hypothetical protein